MHIFPFAQCILVVVVKLHKVLAVCVFSEFSSQTWQDELFQVKHISCYLLNPTLVLFETHTCAKNFTFIYIVMKWEFSSVFLPLLGAYAYIEIDFVHEIK